MQAKLNDDNVVQTKKTTKTRTKRINDTSTFLDTKPVVDYIYDGAHITEVKVAYSETFSKNYNSTHLSVHKSMLLNADQPEDEQTDALIKNVVKTVRDEMLKLKVEAPNG
jgi:hypothetical protein